MDQTAILAQQGTGTSAGYALLIGVDDYESFPDDGLQGSCNDVRMLYWFATNVLGLPPDHVRVLVSSRRVTEGFWEDGEPGSIGPATHDAILDGIRWLAGALAKSPAAPGLLTFSGHGAYHEGSLICPADVGPAPAFARGIALRDLSKMEALQAVRAQLTVVLDCCHVAGDVPASKLRAPLALPHAASADAVADDHESFDLSDRVFLAARLGQAAYQAKLGKVFHGALTFSLVTVAEQWKVTQEAGKCGMDVKNKAILARVRKLLWALRVKQRAELRVPSLKQRKSVRQLPFFGVVGAQAAITARRPDAAREKAQFDGGWRYILSVVTPVTGDPTNPTTTVLAEVIATTNIVTTSIKLSATSTVTPWRAPANTECWYINQAALQAISTTTGSASTLQISASAIASTETTVTLTSPVFANLSTASPDQQSREPNPWQQSTPNTTPSYCFNGTDPVSGDPLTLLLFCVGTGASKTLVHVFWYVTATTFPFGIGPGTSASGPTTLQYVSSPSIPALNTYYGDSAF